MGTTVSTPFPLFPGVPASQPFVPVCDHNGYPSARWYPKHSKREPRQPWLDGEGWKGQHHHYHHPAPAAVAAGGRGRGGEPKRKAGCDWRSHVRRGPPSSSSSLAAAAAAAARPGRVVGGSSALGWCGYCGCTAHENSACQCGCGYGVMQGDEGEEDNDDGIRVRGTFGDDNVDIRVGGKEDKRCGCCCCKDKDGFGCNQEDRGRKGIRRDRGKENGYRDVDDDSSRDAESKRKKRSKRWMRKGKGVLDERVDGLEDDIRKLNNSYYDLNTSIPRIPRIPSGWRDGVGNPPTRRARPAPGPGPHDTSMGDGFDYRFARQQPGFGFLGRRGFPSQVSHNTAGHGVDRSFGDEDDNDFGIAFCDEAANVGMGGLGGDFGNDQGNFGGFEGGRGLGPTGADLQGQPYLGRRFGPDGHLRRKGRFNRDPTIPQPSRRRQEPDPELHKPLGDMGGPFMYGDTNRGPSGIAEDDDDDGDDDDWIDLPESPKRAASMKGESKSEKPVMRRAQTQRQGQTRRTDIHQQTPQPPMPPPGFHFNQHTAGQPSGLRMGNRQLNVADANDEVLPSTKRTGRQVFGEQK